MSDENVLDKKKVHRDRHSGRKAEKKKSKSKIDPTSLTDRQKNPKAFAINSAVRAERKFRRKEDIVTRKQHVPVIDKTPDLPPPCLIAIVGPPKVGKSTLINNLIKSFTRTTVTDIKGPITLVTSKKRRITLIECNNDVNSMIDIAKCADLVLLLCDASFGFEMEIFEFLNICQVHGMPKIMGVLTHLDMIKNAKTLKRQKKILKHRFWTEVYAGAKLFYLSGILHGEYLRNEIANLGRFISVIKFRPLTWRGAHAYLLGDRMEDITSTEKVRLNKKCDRDVILYGYVRGVPLKNDSMVHVAGLGDLRIHELSSLPDPCPLPSTQKKRSLVEKERVLYAPMSGVGGIVYDKDAVYIELQGSHSHKQTLSEKSELVKAFIGKKETFDVQIDNTEFKLFTGGDVMKSREFNDVRNKSDFYKADVLNKKLPKNKKIRLDCDTTRAEASQDSSDEDIEVRLQKEKTKLGLNEERDGTSKRLKIRSDCEMSDAESMKKSSSGSETEDDEERKKKMEKGGLKLVQGKTEEPKNYGITDEMDSNEMGNRKIKSTKRKIVELEEASEEDSDLDEEAREDDELKFDVASSDDEEDHNSDQSSDEEYQQLVDKRYKSKISRTLTENKLELSSDESSDEEFDSTADQNMSKLDHDEVIHDKDIESESEEMEQDTNNEYNELNWKEGLVKRARDAYYDKQNTAQNLMRLVYGVFNTKSQSDIANENTENTDDKEVPEDDTIGGLFTIVTNKQNTINQEKDNRDGEECTFFKPPSEGVRNWLDEENKPLIKNCFVTGKWRQSEDASELLRLDDASDADSEIFGDFEDLETGEKHTGTSEEKPLPDTVTEDAKNTEEENDEKPRTDRITDSNLTKAEIMAKKLKLKAKFDSEYDNPDSTRITGDHSYYENLKSVALKQSELNKSEFANLDEDLRLQIEGHRPGLYVRLGLQNVPCEFVENFDPTYPILIGGLNMAEENVGYVSCKVKKHRWYKKILKTADPLIISLGWRRFQTMPIYSKIEDNMKYRYLKYTPNHVTCNMHFWGPITPLNTGFLALQSCSNDGNMKTIGFRIAATGCVNEMDKSTQIMKKLKLVGSPLKIYKKTAFITGMFNSTLEVAKFEGAKIKTVSGIRGEIKKAVNKPEGCFRATFEDKILLSDIVFCRTWYKVYVPQFYSPITTMLLPAGQKNSWQGMKTVGQMKREQGIRNKPNEDSLYKEIKRDPKVFKPLSIPRNLQKSLPYRDKPKYGPVDPKKPFDAKRIAVVHNPYEQKVSTMMKMLKTSYDHKKDTLKQAMSKRMDKHQKEMQMEENRKLRRQKELKKQVFRTLSKMDIKDKAKAEKGGSRSRK